MRLATPREAAEPVLRRLFRCSGDDGDVPWVGEGALRSIGPAADVGCIGNEVLSLVSDYRRSSGDSTLLGECNHATISDCLDQYSHV